MRLNETIQALITELATITDTLKKEISPFAAESQKEDSKKAVIRLAEIDLQYMAYGLILQGIDPSEHTDFKLLLEASGVNPDVIHTPSKTDLENSFPLYRLAIVLGTTKATLKLDVSTENGTQQSEAEEKIGAILRRFQQQDPRDIPLIQSPTRSIHVDPLQNRGDSEFAELDQAIREANGLLGSNPQTVFGGRRPPTPRPKGTSEENKYNP